MWVCADAFLDSLAERFPGKAETVPIGTSHFGRPIRGLRIGNADKLELFLVGGQHAREWITPASLAYVAQKTLEHGDELLQNHALMIVPLAIPDGYEYSRKSGVLYKASACDARIWQVWTRTCTSMKWVVKIKRQLSPTLTRVVC